MDEKLKDLLSQLGLSSPWITIITVIVSIILLVARSSPVTLVTSDDFERRMYSKEKNLFIRALKFCSKTGITSFIMLGLTVILVNFKWFFKSATGEILLLSSIIIFIIFVLVQNFRTGKSLVGCYEEKPKIKAVMTILSVLFIPIMYILPVLYTARNMNGHVDVGDTIASLVGYLLAVFIFYLVLVAMFHFIFIKTYKEITGLVENLFFENRKKHLYIILKSERWYLQYPIDKHTYYLSNEKYVSKSTMLKLIPIAELRKETFYIDAD